MEAASAVAGTRFEEEGSYAWVEAYSVGDFFDVYSGYLLADVGYGVDVADFCSQEGIACVLDHLRGFGAGQDCGRLLLFVESSV